MRAAIPAGDLWSPRGPQGRGTRLVSQALRPLEGLFRLGVSGRELLYRRGWVHAKKSGLTVVSVGGLEVGGVGKTPLVLELYRLAVRAGLHPAILSRGYKGTAVRSGHVHRVPVPIPDRTAELYGDEPAWLAQAAGRIGGAGVWVASDRCLAARAALEAGANLGILDDGFQHRRLFRNADVVSLSGRYPLANGRMLPAGPLREPPAALYRADRIVLAGVENEHVPAIARSLRPFLSARAEIFSWRGAFELVPVIGEPPAKGETVRLFAGIAHPERLLESLRQIGFETSEARLFADHHHFRMEDLTGWLPLVEGAQETNGLRQPALVTTEKDLSRLGNQLPAWIRSKIGDAGPDGERLHRAEGVGSLDGSRSSVPGLRLAVLRQTLVWNEPGAGENWIRWLREIAAAPDAPGDRFKV